MQKFYVMYLVSKVLIDSYKKNFDCLICVIKLTNVHSILESGWKKQILI